MIISGTGITTFRPKISLEYKIMTQLAIRWAQAADGSWHFTDRGSLTDVYECEVRVYGLKGDVETLVEQIESNRQAGSNQLTLSYFESNENIFGNDIVYTTNITATVLGNMHVLQAKLKSYYTILKLRAIAPTFTGSAAFPVLNSLDIGYNANVQDWTIDKLDSYTGVYSYLDHRADIGIFTGRFQFTDAQLKSLRRYMAINRGATVSIASIDGITHPFGATRGDFPITVKLLELTDENMRGMSEWYATLRLGEVI